MKKIIACGLVLISLMGAVSVASATGETTYENGISVETALSQIRTTISKLKLQVSGGFVQTETLKKLASQLSQLAKVTNEASEKKVLKLVDELEELLARTKGVDGTEAALAALEQVKTAAHYDAHLAYLDSFGFGDVTADKWFHDSVISLAQEGLVQGVGLNDEAGEPLFAPDAPMSRAAYITIAARIAYPDALRTQEAANPTPANWWDNAYQVARETGLIDPAHPDMQNTPEIMNAPIKRMEMARVLRYTARAKGNNAGDQILASDIVDHDDIPRYYRDPVIECYLLGILNGVDDKGTFAPQSTLDRASACQSFYKLLNRDKRTPAKGFRSNLPRGYGQPTDTLQTWVEGEPHTPAQAGDTVIKADGTQVVLTMNQVGNSDLYLLGFGQGVDIITGTKPNPNSDATWGVGYGAWYDNDGTVFKKYDVTGEVYTSQQWSHIASELHRAIDKNVKGSTDGERLGDYFHWNAFLGDWIFHFNYTSIK